MNTGLNWLQILTFIKIIKLRTRLSYSTHPEGSQNNRWRKTRFLKLHQSLAFNDRWLLFSRTFSFGSSRSARGRRQISARGSWSAPYQLRNAIGYRKRRKKTFWSTELCVSRKYSVDRPTRWARRERPVRTSSTTWPKRLVRSPSSDIHDLWPFWLQPVENWQIGPALSKLH